MHQEDINTHMKEKHENEVRKKKNKSRNPLNKFKRISSELTKQNSPRAYQEKELRILNKKNSELASRCDALVNTV